MIKALQLYFRLRNKENNSFLQNLEGLPLSGNPGEDFEWMTNKYVEKRITIKDYRKIFTDMVYKSLPSFLI